MILLISLAWGHPLEASMYGHSVALQIDADRLRIDYEIEIPVAALLQEMRAAPKGEPFGAAKLDELRNGIVLYIDDVVAPTTAIPVHQAGANARFVVYDLAFSAALTPGAHRLRVSNSNAPDEPSVVMTNVSVGPGVSVLDTDVQDRIWRPDAPARESRVDVVIGRQSFLLEPPPARRTLDEARQPTWGTWWLGRETTVASIGVAALLALLAALPAPGASRRDRWAPLLGALSAFLPLPWVAWPVIGGIASANALDPRFRPWASGLIIAALAGSVGWRAAAIVVLIAALGRYFARPLGDYGALLALPGPLWLLVRLLW